MSGIQGARVLVTDDDCVCRRLADFQLRRAGYDVTLATNGQEAWSLLQDSRFDCLVTDEQMPMLSGRELCRAVRGDPRLTDMPIIMVTSKSFEIDPVLLREQFGVIRLLPKPCSPSRLLSTIEDCVCSRD